MKGESTLNLENACILPLHSYHGLRPEILRGLLDTIGEAGDNPAMASSLFQVAIEGREVDQYDLYHEAYTMPPNSLSRLFGIYFDEADVTDDTAPDALLLAEGHNRKVYRGNKVVVTDFWHNPEGSSATPTDLRKARDIAQQLMLSDNFVSAYVFVEQDTIIREMMGGEDKTVAELGLTPEDYSDGDKRETPINRMAQLENISEFSGKSELLQSFSELYSALNPDVIGKGGEEEDLYELRLSDFQIEAFNKLQGLGGTDRLTGLLLERQDCVSNGEYWPRGNEDTNPYYTNGWGDMTVRLQLESDTIVRCYTLSVYMDTGRREADLSKYTAELRSSASWVAKEFEHIRGARYDDIAEATGFNVIDEFEYADLLTMVKNIQAVAKL